MYNIHICIHTYYKVILCAMRNMIYFENLRLKILVINVKTLNMRVAWKINQKEYTH